MKQIRRIDDHTSEIELSRGYWALVDTISLPLLRNYSWSVIKNGERVYAKALILGKTTYMHRLIANAPSHPGLVVDHMNGDGIDNRRSNLRLATQQQNARNSPGASSRRVSTTRGVTKRKHPEQPWRAYIYPSKGQFLHLGYFKSEEEAVKARLKAEKELFGEFSFHCRTVAKNLPSPVDNLPCIDLGQAVLPAPA